MAGKGRVERALDAELLGREGVSVGERAMLHTQARAVDVAERARDPYQVTTATHGYVEVRRAVGLTGREVVDVDPFEQLLSELARPRVGDPQEP